MIRAWLPCTSSNAARRSSALDSFNSRLLWRVQAADSYEHHAVHTVASAISTATTGSIHFFLDDSADFSTIGISTFMLMPGRRYEVKHERDDRVHRNELNAFVPVGLPIAADQRAEQLAHEYGTGLGAVEVSFDR